jgi:O-antigen/teichoic acid export membrane protein
MQIGKKDVLWNYAATVLQIASSLILFPFILRCLPPETIAIWTIFSTVVVLVGLLDFGFNPSFTRNVSYIFSGAKALKSDGFFMMAGDKDVEVNYALLKSLIGIMRLFYSLLAIVLVVILGTLGTYYIHTILKSYSGNHDEVYVAWIILCIINSYSFYTLYYDALLQGKGLVKRAKQIVIIGQLVYLIVGIILILLGFGLVAIVSAQALSIIIRRIFSYLSIYTADMKNHLRNAADQPKKDLFKAVYPNALKVGLTSIGGFLVSRSALIIGSLYLPLESIASYGITVQSIGIISGISMVYFSTYQPKIAQYRIQNDILAIKHSYLVGCSLIFATYMVIGLGLLILGDWTLALIDSQTVLLKRSLILCALVISLLETNHSLAGGILLSKNEVPFFKAALVSGGFTLVLLIIFFNFTDFGVLGMILAPGIAQGLYQNWKWPLVVIRELKINRADFSNYLGGKSNYMGGPK